MSYEGIERRRNWTYVTRNTEYLLRDGICVGVRDRRSGQFSRGHLAVSLKLDGGVRLFPNGAVVPRIPQPAVGDALCFMEARDGEPHRQIVTSRVQSIQRTPREIVEKLYPR
jgi:hypothetical protein